MSAEEVKAKIQAAMAMAIASNTQVMRYSSWPMQFRELKLYGREAGADFVETNLDLIVQEAVGAAECRETSLDIPFYGCGRAAVEGAAATLRDRTGLKVEVQQSLAKLIWAVPNPGFV